MKGKRIISNCTAAAISLAMLLGSASAVNAASAPSDGSYEVGTSLSDEIVKTSPADKVLLVVSFGTSFNETRKLAIGGIESAMQTAFPDYQIRRAFTSQIIIDKLDAREGLRIDDIDRAMQRLVLDQVKDVIIQPTTVMPGYEYDDVMEAIMPYAGKFESFAVGKPLLISDADFDAVAEAAVEETEQYNVDGTAVVLMGHGSHHEASAVYPKLEEVLRGKGCDNYFIGTAEGGVQINDIVESLNETNIKKVALRPLMVVAGDHANNDMAGDEEDSWKNILSSAGFEVETVIEGLGQVKGIQDLLVSHAKAAEVIDAADVPEEIVAVNNAVIPADGTYAIEAETDSSMFRVAECVLNVKDGGMTADITLSGTGFAKIFMGTAEEAAAASENSISNFVLNDGRHSFTVPVTALNTVIDCSAYSANREMWYDHTLTFKSDSIPADALGDSSAEVPVRVREAAQAERQINVTLTGGSGRTTVQSPAKLTVIDGVNHAEIIWSSSNYIYMLVDGEKYLPVNDGGNSAFIIPIDLDTDMNIIGCTTAMSAPREIEYTLRFDSSGIK